MSKERADSARKAAQTIADGCLAGRTRFLNRSLTSIYDDALRPLGVTSGQISILVVVIKQSSVAPVAISGMLNIGKSTLSRSLERMRKAGWIKIAVEGRNQTLTSTAKGRKLLEEALPLWKDAQKTARKLLGPEGSHDLREIADHLSSKLSPS